MQMRRQRAVMQNLNGRQADRRVKARFSPDPQKILKALPLYCIPLTALLLALVLWKYALMAERDLIALRSSEQIKVRFNKEMLLVEIEAILGDLYQAKEMRALKRFVDSSRPGDRTEVDRMFRLFSQHKGIYDQVRYIDKSGVEFVRINYRDGEPSIVPRDHLQDKGDRYYFKETLRLRNGRFFLSPFDLIMENGKIERPINPVFRIGTPVVNNEGVKKGVLILNVRGQILLDRLGEALVNEHHPTWLLDKHGYWLCSEKMDQNWGFMYADGKDKTFQNRFPDEWKRVSNGDEGQFQTDAGLFTYVKAYPLVRSGDLHQMGGPEQGSFQGSSNDSPYHWILLSHVTPSVLDQRTAEMRRITSVLCALAAIFSVIISWFYVRNKIVWELNRAIADDVARLNEGLIASRSVISEHADYNDTLKEALSSARHLSDARYGILSLVKDGETKDFLVDGFTDEEQSNIGRGAPAGGWFAKVISEKKPYRLPDISRTPESSGFPPAYPRMKTFLGVPLMHRDEVLGGLYLTDKEGGRSFTERDEDIMAMLADHIAAVVKKTAMYEELRLGASIFSNSIEGITVTDTSGTIVKVNNAFTAITGYSAEEAIGRNPRILKSDRHHPDFYEAMWRSIEQDGKWEGEIWNRRKNGETYPEWMSISAIRNNKGKTRYYVAVFHDISQVKKSQEKLEYQANHDALTGLPNRQLFQDRLSMALARVKRNGRKLAVLFLDLDSFKNINDTLGHRAGDLLLQGVADRLAGCCREEDTIARLGGDEFVILMSDLEDGGQGAVRLAQRILGFLEKPFQISGNEVLARTSIGITLFPDDSNSAEDLVKYADMAMYKAKKEGKNRYALFTEKINQALIRRVSLEKDLRHALDRNEFSLYYQPIVSIDTGLLTGAEALLRWYRDGAELIPTEEFIPLAEETGVISEIGKWVLYQACRQARQWHDKGYIDLSISVNVSPKQLMDGSLRQTVGNVLNETGLEPERLTLEITENVMVLEINTIIGAMEGISALGVSWSMDDFGTGYSSIKYLQRLPLNEMKIDKSFLKGVPEDSANSKIFISAVALARGFGLKVLAEGVEEDEQLRFLSACGCYQAQGYLFSKPLPAEKFELLLNNYVAANWIENITAVS